jgi:hypothetical protein
MGTKADRSTLDASERAVNGSGKGEATGAGPSEFPRNEIHEDMGFPGNVFGDKEPRRQPSEGEDLQMGLAHRIPFHDEEIIPGEGRDESTGKPDDPDDEKADNGGAAADTRFG